MPGPHLPDHHVPGRVGRDPLGMPAGRPSRRRVRCSHCRRVLGTAEPVHTLTQLPYQPEVCRVCYLAGEVGLHLPGLAARTWDDVEFRHDLLELLETLYELAIDGPT